MPDVQLRKKRGLPRKRGPQQREPDEEKGSVRLKSAYVVLGLPGNASSEDIEIAFSRAQLLYTPQRLLDDDTALAKFTEVKEAYNVLREPSARAAHDRKLAQQGLKRPRPVVVVQDEPSAGRRLLVYGVITVAVVVGAGLYTSAKNAEARKEEAALEVARKAQVAKEEELQRQEEERLRRERVQAKAKEEAEDRRIAMEGQMAGARVAAESRQQEQLALQAQRRAANEAQQQEFAQRAEQRRLEMESRMRIEADKRRIRELCMLQYRRPDC
jgi:curved DNA-binding protein CbpA